MSEAKLKITGKGRIGLEVDEPIIVPPHGKTLLWSKQYLVLNGKAVVTLTRELEDKGLYCQPIHIDNHVGYIVLPVENVSNKPVHVDGLFCVVEVK